MNTPTMTKRDELGNKYWNDNKNFHDSDGVDVHQVFCDGFDAAIALKEKEIEELKAKLAKLTVNAKLYEGKLDPVRYANFWMGIYEKDIAQVKAPEALANGTGE